MLDNFTSYFIAVPIPQIYQDNFKSLIENLNKKYPQIQTVRTDTPHFTLYYLVKESSIELEKIADIIKSNLSPLDNLEVNVGGFGFFGKDRPKVLFLNVDYPSQLTKFNEILSKRLNNYSAKDNSLGFYPHVTAALVKEASAYEEFQNHKQEIAELFTKEKWTFSITEIAIFGADSTKKPEYQEKLISITI